MTSENKHKRVSACVECLWGCTWARLSLGQLWAIPEDVFVQEISIWEDWMTCLALAQVRVTAAWVTTAQSVGHVASAWQCVWE